MLTSYFNNNPDKVRIVYGTLFAFILLYTSIHIVRFASLATDENIFRDTEKGLTIVGITEGGASDLAGLKVGDVITLVNGQSFHDAFQADSILRSSTVGKEINYSIRRDGKESIFKVKLAQAGLPIQYIFLIIISFFILGIGLAVVMMRPAHPIARLFASAFFLVGMYIPIAEPLRGSIYNDFFTAIWPFLRVPALPFGLAALGHLGLHFPVRRVQDEYPRWLLYLFYGLSALIVIIGMLFFRKAGLYYQVSVGILIIAVFVLPVYLYRKQVSEVVREKNKYIRVAAYILLGLFLIQIVFSIWNGSYLYYQYVILLLMSMPILYGYTIIKYRVFDIYLVIRKNFLYTILTWTVVGTFILSILIMINVLPKVNIDVPAIRFTARTIELVKLNDLPPEERSYVEKSVLIACGLVLAFILWRAQKYGRVILERKFYREKYDYKKALQDFSTLSSRISDRNKLAEEVVKKIFGIMHLKGAAMGYISNGIFQIRDSVGLNQECCLSLQLSPDAHWAKELYQLRTSMAIDNLGAKEIFKGSGIQFLTPIISHEKFEGILLLGEKNSETNYTKDDVELLDSISQQVASALETMRLYEEVSEKERMKRELEIARRIQLSSLPAETPNIPGLDIAAISKPALEVGGDFYDFLVRHNEITFILGDVSGKGTSAALYMSRVQGIIRSLDSYEPSLWELFARLNNQVYGHIERNSYVTVIGVRINLLDHSTSFIRAGHLPLIHYHANTRSIEVYQPLGLGVGLDEHQFSRTLTEQKIFPMNDDVILLITDGITEALNERSEEYSVEHLQKVLIQNAHRPAEEIKSSIMDSVTRFVDGSDQHDDMTCVVIKLV